MEQFVRRVVVGGLALVAGLWPVALFDAGSPPWVGGAVLVVLGCVALAAGIRSEIDRPLLGRDSR